MTVHYRDASNSTAETGITASNSDTVLLAQSGWILKSGGIYTTPISDSFGIELNGLLATVTVAGIIDVGYLQETDGALVHSRSIGIGFNGGSSGIIAIASSGTVKGTIGVRLANDSELHNEGAIFGYVTGVKVQGSNALISNSGTIHSSNVGVLGEQGLTLVNSGAIIGAHSIRSTAASSSNTIENAGLLRGDVDLAGSSINTVTNMVGGRIIGN